MLVRVLHGNVGWILDLSDHNAQHRVENGWATYLSDEELDDPTLPGRIGKMPEPLPVQAPVAAVNENVLPAGYQITQDKTKLQNAFLVTNPRGSLIRFKPFPNRMAAICAAQEHKSLSSAERHAMEAKVAVDRAEHEAMERGGISEQQLADRVMGAR